MTPDETIDKTIAAGAKREYDRAVRDHDAQLDALADRLERDRETLALERWTFANGSVIEGELYDEDIDPYVSSETENIYTDWDEPSGPTPENPYNWSWTRIPIPMDYIAIVCAIGALMATGSIVALAIFLLQWRYS